MKIHSYKTTIISLSFTLTVLISESFGQYVTTQNQILNHFDVNSVKNGSTVINPDFTLSLMQGKPTAFNSHFLCGNCTNKFVNGKETGNECTGEWPKNPMSFSQKMESREADEITFIYCHPAAIYGDQKDSFHIILGLNKSNVSKIEIENTFNLRNFYLVNGRPTDHFTLKDDGLKNDKKAGDNIFTSESISTQWNNQLDIFQDYIKYNDVNIQYTSGQTDTLKQQPLFTWVGIMPDRYKIPVIKKLNNTAQHSEYVLNIVSNDKLAGLQPEIFKEYYKYFPDDRDFLLHSTVNPSTPVWENINGYFNGVSNNISGLTKKETPFIYDNSKTFGSNGKLKGVIRTSYGHQASNFLLTHEILHNWAAYIDTKLGISDDGSHWNQLFAKTSGFGSYGDYKSSNIDDTTILVKYTASKNYYNELELYLMGLIPFDSIPFPLKFYEGVRFLKFNVNILVRELIFRIKGEKQLDKEDYFKSMAVRSPDVFSSQKSFKMGYIVTSPNLLTPAEMAYFDYRMREYESNTLPKELQDYCNLSDFPSCAQNTFTIATRGKATLSTRISSFESTTSLKDTKSDIIAIYPNPVFDKIYIKPKEENTGVLNYQLFDITGKKLQFGITSHHIPIVLTTGYKGIAIVHLENKRSKFKENHRIFIY